MNKILRADRTLYLLNDKGDENTFSAFVQPGRGKTMDEALELAKDIERCVNSHEALVQALKEISKYPVEGSWGKAEVCIPDMRKIARKALAAAGEQP